MIQGIVLRRTGRGAGVFRRIGSFNCEQRRMDDDASNGNLSSQRYHEFMRKLEDSGEAVAKSVCAKIVQNAERSKEVFAITVF